MKGLIVISIITPIKKVTTERIDFILKFEIPKTLSVYNSLLLFIETKYHIAEKKIIKGNILITMLGANIIVRVKGN